MAAEYAAFAEQLAEDPFAHDLALKAIQTAIAIEPKNPRAEKIRRGIQNLKETWRDRIRVLRTASLEERDPKNAARLSLLVAKLFADQQPDAAPKIQEALDRCFSLWPAMPEALWLLEHIATKNGDPASFASALEKMATQAKDLNAKVDLFIRLGVWKLTQLQDQAGALAAFEKAAGLDPGRAEAVGLAAEQMIEANRTDNALELLERHLQSLRDRSAEVALRLRLADLYIFQVQDVAAARRHLEAILQVDPFNTQAAFQLAELFLQSQELEPLESVLTCALRASVTSLTRRIFIGEVVDAFAKHQDSRRAFGVLKRLLREPARPPNLVAALIAHAKASHAEWDLAVALRHAAELAEGDAVELWRSLATLLEDSGGRSEESLAAWREVLKRAPDDPAAKAALATVRKASSKQPRTTSPEPTPAPTAASPRFVEPAPAAARPRSAEPAPVAASSRSGDLQSAMQGLSANPANQNLRAEAKRLAKAAASERELAKLLAQLAERVPDSKLAVTLLREAAQLSLDRGAVEDASLMLQSALLHSPDDPEILDRLLELHLKSQRIAEADQVLRRRILVAEDGEKSGLYVRFAELQQQLSKPKEAAEALQNAIKAGAAEVEHLPRVAQLLEASGQVDALSLVLARQIELAESAKDKKLIAELNQKRSQLVAASAKSRAEAIKRSVELLQQRPFDPTAISELEGLLGDPSYREEAARALLPAYEWSKDHRKLVGALEVIATSAKDSLERLLSLKRAAYIHLHQLRQPDLAFGALVRALRLSPADAALRNVARQAAQDANALDTFAEILEELLESDVGPARFAIHRELAELYEKRLNNPAGTITQLNKALTLDPKNTEVLRILQRLYRGRRGALLEANCRVGFPESRRHQRARPPLHRAGPAEGAGFGARAAPRSGGQKPPGSRSRVPPGSAARVPPGRPRWSAAALPANPGRGFDPSKHLERPGGDGKAEHSPKRCRAGDHRSDSCCLWRARAPGRDPRNPDGSGAAARAGSAGRGNSHHLRAGNATAGAGFRRRRRRVCRGIGPRRGSTRSGAVGARNSGAGGVGPGLRERSGSAFARG